MTTKCQKFRSWTADEKYKIIKPALDMEKSTCNITKETGFINECGLITSTHVIYNEDSFFEKENIEKLSNLDNLKLSEQKGKVFYLLDHNNRL